MGRIIKYLELNQIGVLELLFAAYLIFISYHIGTIPGQFLFILIMDVVVLLKRGKFDLRMTRGLTLFFVYYVLHQIGGLFLGGSNSSLFWNMTATSIFCILSIYYIFPNINLNKLFGSLNWIAIISIIGVVYHFGIIQTGGEISKIQLPFLTSEVDDIRLLDRPSSFYNEPAAFCGFMYMPLALSLYKKKYFWSTVIILSLFLSTSTTGLIVSFLMLGVYALTQSLNKKYKILLIFGMVALAAVLVNFSVFSKSVEKLQSVDTETNIRLAQGPIIVADMDKSNLLFGVPYATAYAYYEQEHVNLPVVIYGDNLYMSSFWLIILLLGVVGLILYVNVYIQLARKYIIALPYLIMLIAVLFSDPTYTGGDYACHMIFALCLCRLSTKKQ